MWTIWNSATNSVTAATLTGKHSELHHPLAISLVLSDGSLLQTGHRFVYQLDPRLTDIEPRNHLIRFVFFTLLQCRVDVK